MPITPCADCGCDCSLIDAACIYANTGLSKLVQIETKTAVLNAAHERVRSLLGDVCYFDFCAARAAYLSDGTPLPTKWNDLFNNKDFQNLLSLWVYVEYLQIPEALGISLSAAGGYKTGDNDIKRTDLTPILDSLTAKIAVYEKRVNVLMQLQPYDCARCNECLTNECTDVTNSCTPSSGCGCEGACSCNRSRIRVL